MKKTYLLLILPIVIVNISCNDKDAINLWPEIEPFHIEYLIFLLSW